MTTQQNTLIKTGAAIAAAVAGYEFLYKPWKAKQDALALGTIDPTTGLPTLDTTSPLTSGSPGSATPPQVMYPLAPGGGYVPTPVTSGTPPTSGGGGGTTYTTLPPYVDTSVNNPPVVQPPAPAVGPPPSNLNPGAAVGGPVGTAMTRKNWTQAQATQRLNDITTSYAGAVAAYNDLASGSGVAEANQTIAAEQTALNGAMVAYNNAIKNGDAAGAAAWQAAITGHQNDINEINGRLSNIQNSMNAWLTDINGLKSDYYALTGLNLG